MRFCSTKKFFKIKAVRGFLLFLFKLLNSSQFEDFKDTTSQEYPSRGSSEQKVSGGVFKCHESIDSSDGKVGDLGILARSGKQLDWGGHRCMGAWKRP